MNRNWDGSTDDDWNIGTNWSGNAVPNGADRAYIDLPAGPVIDGLAATSVIEIRVGNIATGTLNIQNGGSITSTGSTYVGSSAGSTGEATVDGASSSLTSTTAMYVGNAGGIGTLNVRNNGAVSSADVLYVGNSLNGTGMLNVQSGADVTTTGGIFFGSGGTGIGTGIVDGTGSTLHTNGQFYVGGSATGTLTVRNDGSASSTGIFYVGSSGTGTLHVQSGGDVTSASSFIVGNNANSNGTLNILSGGAVSSVSHAYLGYNTDSTGTATVNGTGARLETTGAGTDLYVGYNGTGTLNVENGGTVAALDALSVGNYSGANGTVNIRSGASISSSGHMYLGHSAGGTGTVTAEGNGSFLETTDATSDIYVGNSGTGTLNVKDNASVTANRNIYVSNNSGASGTLNVESGGDVSSSAYIYVGNNTGSDGTATIDGTGSTLHASSGLRVGHSGTGTLEVKNGADVTTDGSAYIGNSASGNGTVTVTGTGSTFSSDIEMSVGVNGTGTLNVLAGGKAGSLTNNIVFGQHNTTSGSGNSNGTGLVSGTGSRLETGNQLRIGNNGTGTLTIEDEGSAQASSAIYVGTNAASNGTLNISSGGSLTGNDFIYIANAATATGNATVEGTGSRMQGSQLRIGNNGTGTLTIEDGGSVISTGNAAVGNTGNSIGTLTIRNGGSFDSGGFLYFAANSATSTGNASVSGADSLLHSDGDLSFGQAGSSTVTIEDDARATTNSLLSIGVNSGANGTLTLRNGGTVATSGGLSIATNLGSTGTLNIGADALGAAAAAGTVDAATVAFGAGTGKIVFNHTDTGYTFNSALSGAGDLDLLAGETVFTADSAGFTGSLDVLGGSARVNADFGNANTTVGTGARIGGAGRVNDLVVGSGGAIAPGNSIGTFTVMGDFTHDANATYHVEVNNAGGSDLIDISGIANLGGLVSVTMEPGAFAPVNTYTILSAAGGLNGTFAGATSINALFDAGLTYDANNVYLSLDRNNFTFGDIAGPVGAAFDAVPDSDPAKQLLLSSDDASIAQSLQNAATAPYPDESATVTQVVEKIHTVIDNRIAMLRAGDDGKDQTQRSLAGHLDQTEPAAGFVISDAFDRDGDIANRLALDGFGANWLPRANHWGAWVQGYGVTGHTRQGGSRLDYDYAGIAAGIDYKLSPEMLAGATLGYARGFGDFRPGNGDSTTDMYQAAGYLAYTKGPWHWQGMGGYGIAATDAERRILFGGLPLRLRADYDTHIWHANVEGGHEFRTARDVALTPLLGLSYSRQEQEAFTERGSGAGLSLRKNVSQSVKPAIGLRAETQIEKADGSRITPALTARLRHELGDDTADVNGSFAGAGGIGPAFALRGIERARTEANIEAGVSYDTPDNTSYFASYGTTQSATTAEHEMLMGVKVRF